MRSAALVGLTLVLFASRANAQQPPYRAVVTDPEVKVRSAPSDRLDETGTLLRGTVVIVEREEANGWLAITAPYGSVSWVSLQFINDPALDKKAPKNVYVDAEDGVTLAVGKAGLAQPLDIRRTKVPDGTILLVIGEKVTISGKSWYPVCPPAGDVRYVPKTAVQIERPVTNNVVVHVNENQTPLPPPAVAPPAVGAAPGVGPIATVPGPGSSPAPAGGIVASKPAVNHPLWIQAEAAEREGRLADAEKAYFDLAALMNGQGGDRDVANLCYTRIHAIREKRRASNTTGAGQPVKDDRGVKPGAPQAVPVSTGSNTNTNPRPDGAPSNDPSQDWIGPGTLRISALTLDGIDRKTYALETNPGTVKVYVLAGPGVDLSRYVNKRVNVLGTPQTRPGLSKQYVVAMDVAPAPQ
jgi:hypothetical protein